MTTPADPARAVEDPMPSAPASGPLAVDRDAHPRRCAAMSKRSGRRCRAYAVEGMTVCRMHGGASPQARAAAERRKAESEATALLEQVWQHDAPPVANVVEALYQMAGQLQHALNVLGARVNTTSLAGPEALAWSRVMREQRQLLAEVARLGIEEKRVQLEQDRAALVTTAFRAALAVVELLPADRDAMVRAFLAGLGAPVEEPVIVRGEVEARAPEDGS